MEESKLNQPEMRRRMKAIQHKIIVLSGKGGVGKSTVAVNVAMALTMARKQVGLFDADVHGPSVPKLMGLEKAKPVIKGDYLVPPEFEGDMKVMSLGFLIRGKNEAVVWRGPMKTQAINQLLKDTLWGPLDYLVIDCPPGTGDEPLSVIQLIGDVDGAVVVTTPQEVALADVRRSINFCQALKVPVLGVVENMSGFVCPHCGERTDIFKSGSGEAMAAKMGVPFLGSVPIDPEVMRSCDAGRPYVYYHPTSETANAFGRIVEPILAMKKDETAPNAS